MPIDLRLSPENPNTRQHSEFAFRQGAVWDQNQGSRQTHLFAECFHKYVKVPVTGKFTMLDIGCALGDALPVWHQHYPQARLFGCDVAQSAIIRCRQKYSDIAEFFLAGFEDLNGTWDVIYCSNVLEHFEQHVEIAAALLAHCTVLYVMVPYLELRNGKPLSPKEGEFHVATFSRHTFDVLRDNHKARVNTKIIRCPIAWTESIKSETINMVKSVLRGRLYVPRRQIVYTILPLE